jgi:chloride channel, nucleotide-sensitive, 1A
MEVLREPPSIATFVPLAEHQSATPASFYSGPPVLHYYSDRSKVRVLQQELGNASAFGPLFGGADVGGHSALNGDSQANGDWEKQKTTEGVDVWVTSEYESSTCARITSN